MIGQDGRIKAIRKEMGLTIEEFAHEVGVTASTVSRWEHGANTPTKICRIVIRRVFTEWTERHKQYASKYDPLNQ